MSADDPAGSAPVARGDAPRRAATWLLCVALAVVSAAFAYFGMFRQFQGYDDEGYLMVAVQHLLDGRKLYDDVVMVYGPGYFAYRWLIHGLCGLELGSDVVRLTSIALWLVTAALYGVVAHRLCKGSKHAGPLAVIATAFTIFHLRVLAHEPGHPQELATALVGAALCLAAVAFESKRRDVAFCHGLIVGILVLVKANLGAFFAAASLLAWVVDAPRRKAWGVAVLGAAACGALALPFVLLRARFEDPPAVILCTVVTCALGISFVHAMKSRADAHFGFGDLVAFALGTGFSTVSCLVFIALHGSSIARVFHSLFVASQRFATEFMFTFQCDWKAVCVSAVSSAAALVLWRGGRWLDTQRAASVLALVKLAFGVIVLWACIRDPEILVEYGTPWVWLAMIAPDRTFTPEEAFLRRLVCFTAVLQVLQIFPVPGSQVNVGSAPLLLIAAACMADALRTIELRAVESRTASIVDVAAFVTAATVVGWFGWRTVDGMEAYRRRSSLDFRGCRLTRVPEWQAMTYRWLVDNLEASSDTFLSVQGQNSLYSWTGRKPASSVIVSTAWNLFDAAQHTDLVETHRSRPDVMVVDNPQVFGAGKRDYPFFRFIDQDLTPLARVGQNTLMVRQGRSDVALVGCAWWIETRSSDASSEPLPPVLARQLASSPSMRALRMSISPGRIVETADKVELVEAKQALILGSSDSLAAEQRVQLFDASGEPLLPGRIGGATPAELCDPRGAFVLVPGDMVPERTELPALRFSRGDERLLTIPIAQRARRR